MEAVFCLTCGAALRAAGWDPDRPRPWVDLPPTAAGDGRNIRRASGGNPARVRQIFSARQTAGGDSPGSEGGHD